MPSAKQWSWLLAVGVAVLAIFSGSEKFFGIPVRVQQLESVVKQQAEDNMRRFDELTSRMGGIETKMAASAEWQQRMLDTVTRMNANLDQMRADVSGMATRVNRTDDKLVNYQVSVDNELARLRQDIDSLHTQQRRTPPKPQQQPKTGAIE